MYAYIQRDDSVPADRDDPCGILHCRDGAWVLQIRVRRGARAARWQTYVQPPSCQRDSQRRPRWRPHLPALKTWSEHGPGEWPSRHRAHWLHPIPTCATSRRPFSALGGPAIPDCLLPRTPGEARYHMNTIQSHLNKERQWLLSAFCAQG